MKMKYSALLLATSLLAAPALVNAEGQGEQNRGHHGQHSQMKDGCEMGHKGMHKSGYHGKRHHGMGGHMMDAERFEKYLEKRLDKLETPDLKAQFIASYQARLASAEQSMLLRKLMAEHKAEQIENKELKAATLEKVTAEHKLKQLRIKQMQDLLTDANK
ncbi:hypothetical protein [Oceanisphaera pacifica]|uniref:Zinc resistance-associated protein n=1 Tax=Oceanisphaera pacifica TaxID=2818389 RepID=A0ABS3NF70_9GAMM|nr:hypothetical protein [Oceanisphaera pacifica]MBO1519214.1 hypothetical protein [Oceanisphaera pacifica]